MVRKNNMKKHWETRRANDWKMSDETKRKIGIAGKNRKASDSTKEKLRKTTIFNNPKPEWFKKGWETRRKNENDRVSNETRQKISKSLFGVKRTEESINAQKDFYTSMSEDDREKYFRSWIDAGQKASRKSVSKIEDTFARMLEESNIKFERQVLFSGMRVDFYLPDRNLIVEIYGCFWHQCRKCGHINGIGKRTFESIRQKDKQKREKIRSTGFTLKIIWEHDLND